MSETEQKENTEIATRIFDGWVAKAPMIKLYRKKFIVALSEDMARELAPYRQKIKDLEDDRDHKPKQQ